MITIPVVIAYGVFGAAGAAGAWLFHKIFKTKQQVVALELRLSKLEGKQ
jgi:hypothetical protein